MRELIIGYLLVFISYVISLTSATVLFKPLSISFPDLPAKYAVAVDRNGICGALHVANPVNACSPLRSRFSRLNGTTEERIRFALIVRGECAFDDKVKHAQNAGFRAAIVYDDRDKANLVYMMVNLEGIKVHAVFVSKAAGEMLKESARGEQGECCIYPIHNGRAWTVLAISLLSLLVILVLLVIIFFTPGHWLNWQCRNNHPKSVDTKMVEALPCFAFGSACSSNCRTGETCAICLEDYKDGEIIKVLPCQHEFHSSCVDSWLTKWGTFCPVCKLDMRTKIAKSEVKRGIWF